MLAWGIIAMAMPSLLLTISPPYRQPRHYPRGLDYWTLILGPKFSVKERCGKAATILVYDFRL
jgi:hypothetical protein